MNEPARSTPPPDVVDQLVEHLLNCGGVLSQIVTHMVESQASGRSSPDAPEVLEVAHELIRSVIGPVSARHPAAELATAAVIVDEVTTEICEEIFLLPPDFEEPSCRRPRGAGGGRLRNLPRR